MSVYPGKKSKNGIPNIMRRILDGNKIITKISAQASRFSGMSALPNLILNEYALLVQLASQGKTHKYLSLSLDYTPI
jgi:hypothetical protein